MQPPAECPSTAPSAVSLQSADGADSGLSQGFLDHLESLAASELPDVHASHELRVFPTQPVCIAKRFRRRVEEPQLPVQASSQVPSDASWDVIANPISGSESSVGMPIMLPLRPKAPPPAPRMQRMHRTSGSKPRVGTNMFDLAPRGVPHFAAARPLPRPSLLRIPSKTSHFSPTFGDAPLPPPIFRHRSSYPGFKSVLDDDIPPMGSFQSSVQNHGKGGLMLPQHRDVLSGALRADIPTAGGVAVGPDVQPIMGRRSAEDVHIPTVAAKRPRIAGGALQADVHARNWSRVLVLWALVVSSLGPASHILRQAADSVNSEAITRSLLSRVSDTTALRYLKVLQVFLETCSDLGFSVHSLSAVQLIDVVCAMRSEPRQKIHSTNSLKAILWLTKVLQLEWCVFSPDAAVFRLPQGPPAA